MVNLAPKLLLAGDVGDLRIAAGANGGNYPVEHPIRRVLNVPLSTSLVMPNGLDLRVKFGSAL